jgi:hypothetical protein
MCSKRAVTHTGDVLLPVHGERFEGSGNTVGF